MSVGAFDLAGRFEPGVAAPPVDGAGWWFVFHHRRLLVRQDPAGWSPPQLRDARYLGLPLASRHYLGQLDGLACWAATTAADEPADVEPPPAHAFVDLLGLHGRLPLDLYLLAGRAVQILEWDRDHRHCGRCGGPTEAHPRERRRDCPRCGLRQYPRLAPAIMALVRREERLLLARGAGFPAGLYSALAGFVEPGETLEAAVHREVHEEVGVRVANLRYFGSQPWPFPHSLMAAFLCDWAGGELVPDGVEIAQAGWFGVDELPLVPGEMSIAGWLIRHALAS